MDFQRLINVREKSERRNISIYARIATAGSWPCILEETEDLFLPEKRKIPGESAKEKHIGNNINNRLVFQKGNMVKIRPPSNLVEHLGIPRVLWRG